MILERISWWNLVAVFNWVNETGVEESHTAWHTEFSLSVRETQSSAQAPTQPRGSKGMVQKVYHIY